nr:MAG TPA: hypothetical protein [Caudoviricetes sp.]
MHYLKQLIEKENFVIWPMQKKTLLRKRKSYLYCNETLLEQMQKRLYSCKKK